MTVGWIGIGLEETFDVSKALLSVGLFRRDVRLYCQDCCNRCFSEKMKLPF